MAPKQWHPHSKHNKLDSILAAFTTVVKGQGAKAGGNGSKGQEKGKGKTSKQKSPAQSTGTGVAGQRMALSPAVCFAFSSGVGHSSKPAAQPQLTVNMHG